MLQQHSLSRFCVDNQCAQTFIMSVNALGTEWIRTVHRQASTLPIMEEYERRYTCP